MRMIWDTLGGRRRSRRGRERTSASRQMAVVGGLLAGVLLALCGRVSAQPFAALDYEVKAGFLVKFTQYTTWPANAFAATNSPIVIGVVAGDSLFKEVERQAAGVVSSRPVTARRIETLEEAAGCQLIFIAEAEARYEAEWFKALKGKPIVTVGESERTIEHGGVLHFVIKNKTVRFEASLAASAENRFELSEKMLGVASKVYKRPPVE